MKIQNTTFCSNIYLVSTQDFQKLSKNINPRGFVSKPWSVENLRFGRHLITQGVNTCTAGLLSHTENSLMFHLSTKKENFEKLDLLSQLILKNFRPTKKTSAFLVGGKAPDITFDTHSSILFNNLYNFFKNFDCSFFKGQRSSNQGLSIIHDRKRNSTFVNLRKDYPNTDSSILDERTLKQSFDEIYISKRDHLYTGQ